ncbi:MAG: T9SS type A sorting domain-containing protein [Bacteroidia bacterium]
MPVNATWEIDGGEFLSNNLAKSVLVKWNRIGKNKLILKYFTGDCKDSTVIETVLSAVKQPFFAGPDVVACHGDSVILGMPPIPNCRYEWLDLRYIAFEQWEFESYIKKRFYSQSKKTDLVIIYKVFLTDTISGCKFVDTVKLIVKPRLKTNITATVGCYREIASFSTDTLPADAYWFAEGGEIITDNKAKSIFVKWSRNGTNIIKLRYNFNGCTDSAVYMADIDSLTHFPIIGADSIFENTFHTYTVEKLGKTENKWRVTGGEIISETENAITIQWGNTNADANIWTYKINDKGCFSDTSLLPVTIKKRENLDLSHTFHVYPNPFSNNIMIAPVNDFSGEIRIVLSDMLGRKMLEQTAYMQSGKNALNLNVSAAGLKSGFYNINIIYPQGKSTWKLVRE